jgi:hypothetical protein
LVPKMMAGVYYKKKKNQKKTAHPIGARQR